MIAGLMADETANLHLYVYRSNIAWTTDGSQCDNYKSCRSQHQHFGYIYLLLNDGVHR